MGRSSRHALASPRERYAAGQKLREQLPRKAHGTWTVVAPDTPDRLRTLDRGNLHRLPHLLPEKHKRMRASPFAFFRGSAALMAADLAGTPRTGATVQICGDAHVRNLGAYAAPDGRLVFDLNDFDETIRGPWEWDVKRLATSLMLAGQEAGLSRRRCEDGIHLFVRSYREHLTMFATMGFAALARYLIARRQRDPLLEQIFREAGRVTPERNLKKLTVRRRGRAQFHDRPPLLERVSAQLAVRIVSALRTYAASLTSSRRRTFERYVSVDVAFKLVGTGSVGTRNYVVLLFGNGPDDPLFLQVKQQMQTLSDPFLGYTRFGGHDYLVRQLADHKAALDPTKLDRRTLPLYALLSGEVLAKGHARTGDAALLAGYAGGSAKLDRAIAAFAVTYAEQVRTDYTLFRRSRAR
jgi:hypothetical protein